MSAFEDLIFFANESFYAAFASGDVAIMDAVWAVEAKLACLHPGAPPLFERGAIMESWRQILSDEGVSTMTVVAPRVLTSSTMAVVNCYEVLGSSGLVATNGFVQERGVWKMALHHASPCPTNLIPTVVENDAHPLH